MSTFLNTRFSLLAILCLLLVFSVPQPGITQQAALSGIFSVVWGDGPQGTGLTDLRYHLADDQGATYRLLVAPDVLEAAGGMLALNGRRVLVSGTGDAPRLPLTGPSDPTVQVASITLDPASRAARATRVSGSVPWVTIMCKFSDVSAEPKSKSYIEGLMGPVRPGLDFYWREVSFNNINIVGSVAVGWVTLPQPRSYYVYGGNFDFTRATNDCTNLADPSVYFPDFDGIQMLFNDDLDGFAWGGSRYLNLDGVPKTYSTTWYPPWGYNNQSVIAHEMGHGLGLPHSSGPYGATYDSMWDVMSDAWACGPNWDPTYRCLGQHTISYHKDILGWIPAEKKMVVAPGARATFELDRLGMPTGDGYLMATIPVNATTFYTVERREFVGFDLPVPGEGVVIHEVVLGRSRRAQVVDPDGSDPNDDGAIWVPGETWTDPGGGRHVIFHSMEMFLGDVNVPAPPQIGFGLGLGPEFPTPVPAASTRGSTSTAGRLLITVVNGT